MGMGVVPIIGQIITTVVVSKVATKVAGKLGFSDSVSSIIGAVAGIYTGNMAATSLKATATPPMGGVKAPAVPDPTQGQGGMLARSDVVGTGAGGGGPAGFNPIAKTGINSAPVPAAVPSTTTAPGAAANVPAATPPAGNWWDKIWSSDNARDSLVGAAGGAAQGYMQGKAVEDAQKADNEREDEISNRWKKYDIDQFQTIAYPNKARSGMLTRGQA